MKFSVLLPTHNRLDLLKYAIASVIQQDEQEFEIIIADNFSEEDIQGYILSLHEPRIKYFRTPSFISVTDNWNFALNQSSGEWIIMLGDDDCLMKGYFSTARKILDDFPQPDFIYTNGFLFAYPQVLPHHPNGLVKTFGNAGFFSHQTAPRWLLKKETEKLVEQTFDFRCVFAFNMQFALMSRAFIDHLKKEGRFFHSPYPDYYAMTLMMLMGQRVVSCPYPLVGVGISRKSFGYYYFNHNESKGVDFLNNSNEMKEFPELNALLLPGTEMNNCWLLSMRKIQAYFPDCKFKLNYHRYRIIQMTNYFDRNQTAPSRKELLLLCEKLSLSEKLLFIFPWYLLSFFPAALRKIYVKCLKKFVRSHAFYPTKTIAGYYENIQRFFEKIDPLNFDE